MASSNFADKLAALHPTRRKPKAVAPNSLSTKTDTMTEVKLVGIQSTSSRNSQKFIIQRLLPNLSRSGFKYIDEGFEPEFVENWEHDLLGAKPIKNEDGEIVEAEKDTRAGWRYGSMLLLPNPSQKKLAKREMINIFESKKTISDNLLRTIELPWGLPTTLPFATEKKGGVPLKIVYPKKNLSKDKGGGRTFEAGEPLLVLTKPGEDPDCLLPVIDFQGRRGDVYAGDLIEGLEKVPWGIRVDRAWMEDSIKKFDEEACVWAKDGLLQRLMKQKDVVMETRVSAKQPQHKGIPHHKAAKSIGESAVTAADLSSDDEPLAKRRGKKHVGSSVKEGMEISDQNSDEILLSQKRLSLNRGKKRDAKGAVKEMVVVDLLDHQSSNDVEEVNMKDRIPENKVNDDPEVEEVNMKDKIPENKVNDGPEVEDVNIEEFSEFERTPKRKAQSPRNTKSVEDLKVAKAMVDSYLSSLTPEKISSLPAALKAYCIKKAAAGVSSDKETTPDTSDEEDDESEEEDGDVMGIEEEHECSPRTKYLVK